MYSLEKDNETWYCDDIDELIQQGIADEYLTLKKDDEIIIYSGVCEIRKASNFLVDMVELLTENAVEECGEVAESWLEGSGEMLQDAMSECLENWCDKYGKTVQFGCIEIVKPVHIIILKVQGDDVEWVLKEDLLEESP
jgi:hypothetical protein